MALEAASQRAQQEVATLKVRCLPCWPWAMLHYVMEFSCIVLFACSGSSFHTSHHVFNVCTVSSQCVLLRLPRVSAFVSTNLFTTEHGSAARTQLTASRVLPKGRHGMKVSGPELLQELHAEDLGALQKEVDSVKAQSQQAAEAHSRAMQEQKAAEEALLGQVEELQSVIAVLEASLGRVPCKLK